MRLETKKFVIGDIHGGYLALVDILKKPKLTPSDTLVFLGDYVDGWSDSPKVLDYLIDLQTRYTCIFLRGNHDQLLLDWFITGIENPLWLAHGGQSTIDAYKNISEDKKQKHIQFLESLSEYHLDDQNRLFVHAGFTNPNGAEFEYFPKMFYWDRTLWETAIALDQTIDPSDVRYPKRFKLYHEVYIGHTPVTRMDKTIPVGIKNIWNIDTGAAFKGALSLLDVSTKQFWQSRPVCDYYPNEKGRN